VSEYEIICCVLSSIAILISLYTVYYSRYYLRKQLMVQQAQLEEMQKKKFTDDPINPYTHHLGAIAKNLGQMTAIMSEQTANDKNQNREKA